MRILLYGINYSPELTGIGKYSGEFCQWAAEQGHEVRVVTAPPYYPDWKVFHGYSSWRYSRAREDGVQVLRCPLYVPSNPTALTRLLHLGSFAVSSFFGLLTHIFWRPQLVVLVVPTLFCAPAAAIYASLKNATSVVHIQDYEVDAMFGLAMVDAGPLRRFAYAIERFLLRRFDKVSTISSGMMRRATEKGVDSERLVFFPNWSDTSRFESAARDELLLSRLGADLEKKTILYSGSMGAKQGLEIIVEAAEELRHRADLQFLIVGDGFARQSMIEAVETRTLENVIFAGLQPYEDLPALLASADCHLIVQKRGAADSVLPSKLTNILAVGGNAVITADSGTSLGDLCDDFPGIAHRVEPESLSALVDGILRVLEMPVPNTIATSYAKKYLDKDMVLSGFLGLFEDNA